MYIDFDALTPSQRYFAMVQSIIPRPIAWVLTNNASDGDGQPSYNLAPFSFFTAVCSDPPLLMFSAGKKATGDEAGQVKDTCRNIQENKHFVLHIASTDMLDAVNGSAATLDHGISEVEALGLKTVPFEGSELPRLANCSIALACSLYRIDEIGNTPQAVIYGQINTLYVDDEIITPSEQRLIIDGKKLDPLARLGGNYYGNVGDFLMADRPK